MNLDECLFSEQSGEIFFNIDEPDRLLRIARPPAHMLPDQNLIRIQDPNIEVSRILSLKWFEAMFHDNALTLVRPTMYWDDPYENFFFKCTINDDGHNISLESLRDNWYGQSWTKRSENDAQWRIYSQRPELDTKGPYQGVRIKTKLSKLLGALWDADDKYANLIYFAGAVHYCTQTEIDSFLASTSFWSLAIGGQSKNFAETLLIKRDAFDHEDEVRLLVFVTGLRSAKLIDPLDPGILRLKVSVVDLIDEVLVDPRLSEDEAKVIVDRIRTTGYTGRVEQSNLYRFHPRSIRAAH